MARILILRNEQAAVRTAQCIEAEGDTPLVLPTQAIRPLAPDLPPGPFGALVLTSANAVPFLARCFARPHPPILAVGRATAHALREDGFVPAMVGKGTGAGLAAEAARLHAASGLPLLYLAGRVRTDGFERALRDRGVRFETVEVYDTVPMDPDAETVAHVLGGAGADAALLLSAGQAEAFERLVRAFAQNFDPPPTPLCLSSRIAEALSRLLREGALIAPRPELSALLGHYRRYRQVSGR